MVPTTPKVAQSAPSSTSPIVPLPFTAYPSSVASWNPPVETNYNPGSLNADSLQAQNSNLKLLKVSDPNPGHPDLILSNVLPSICMERVVWIELQRTSNPVFHRY
jgi:hypothetical protein